MKLINSLHDEKVELRTLAHKDISDTYINWLLDPAVNAFLELRFQKKFEKSDVASFIKESNSSSHTLMLGIFLRSDNIHIGNIKLGPIDWHHNVSDIGFLIGDKNQWGKGYATRSIKLISNYAFEKLKLFKLNAGCYSKNMASKRALQKAKFKIEGIQSLQWQVDDNRQDGILLGLLNPKL